MLVEARVDIVKEHILKTLLYFDIFHYPLKLSEVHRFLGVRVEDTETLSSALHELIAEGLVYHRDGLYGFSPDVELYERRIRGNEEARRISPLAYHQGAHIAKFPFVRGVLASGSFSKGYMDEASDLDFFIVAAKDRLWVARTLLVLYKRIFLANSHKHFCVNYFVAEDHLLIDEQNAFTATELATVIPLDNADVYVKLLGANHWLKTYFPNYRPRISNVGTSSESRFKRLIELLFTPFAGVLNTLFRQLTRYRWNRIYRKQMTRADFDIAFKSTVSASKNHPRQFQRKVLEKFQEKLKNFSKEHHYTWQS